MLRGLRFGLVGYRRSFPVTSRAVPLWLYWILLGLVAGALAKFLVPGRDPAGCIVTVVLGIAGAILGGWIGSMLGWGQIDQGQFSIRSIGLATLGAIVLLLLGRLAARWATARRTERRR